MKNNVLIIIIFFLQTLVFAQGELSESDIDIVIDDATIGLKNDNYNFDLLKIRGAAYQLKEEYKKAVLDYRKALEIKKDKEVLSYLGNTYMELGMYDSSILAHTLAIQLDSKYYDSYIGRAYSNRIKGNYEKSLADLKVCLNLSSEDNFILSINLGATYLMLNEFKKSEFYLLKADSINKKNPVVFFYKAIFEMKNDSYETMCLYYKKSLQYGLSSDFEIESFRKSLELRCKNY